MATGIGRAVGETQRKRGRKRRCRYFAQPDPLTLILAASSANKIVLLAKSLSRTAKRFCYVIIYQKSKFIIEATTCEHFLVGEFASIHPRSTNVAPTDGILHARSRIGERGEGSEPIISSR